MKRKREEVICHRLGKEASGKAYLNSCRMRASDVIVAKSMGLNWGDIVRRDCGTTAALWAGHGTGERENGQRLMIIWDLPKLEKVL